MRMMRRINRMAILLFIGLFLCLYFTRLDLHFLITFPLMVMASYVAEFITVILIMAFNLEDTISYKAFGADDYEKQHYPTKLNQDGQIQS